MIFTVNGVDYSHHVIAGTYDVHDSSVYEEIRDGNGNKHRYEKRKEVVGSFDMFFKTLEEYQEFSQSVKAATNKNTNATTISVTINNEADEQREIDAFVRFTPTRNRNYKWQDYMERFRLELEER